MAQLIIVRGIQGSGKSTWAREYVEQDPKHRVRFNNDDIRNMLGKYWVPDREHLVDHLKTELLKEAMRYGYDIVVDNMNLNPKEVIRLANVVNVHNAYVTDKSIIKPDRLMYTYTVEFKDFKTPLDECIKRDAQRENPIGEQVIRQTYNRYKEFYEK